MSHPNGALQAVATDGLMTEHLPHSLTHDSSHPEGAEVWAVSAGGLGTPRWAASRSLQGRKWMGTGSLWDRLLCLSLCPACQVSELGAHVPLEALLRCSGSDASIEFY